MQKPLYILLLFLATAALSSCGNNWQAYETSEFSIEFPGPTRDTATMEGNMAGARTFYEPVEGSLDSNLYYAVSLYTLPDSIAKLGDNLDDLYRTDVQIYAWSIGGTLDEKIRVVKSGTIEGREFSVILEGNSGVATVRKFAYGKHLYTLLVVTDNARLNNAQIRRFMDSFKLKGKK